MLLRHRFYLVIKDGCVETDIDLFIDLFIHDLWQLKVQKFVISTFFLSCFIICHLLCIGSLFPYLVSVCCLCNWPFGCSVSTLIIKNYYYCYYYYYLTRRYPKVCVFAYELQSCAF